MSPDCRDGKHAACVGEAWDPVADGPCDCTCTCHVQDNAAELQAMVAEAVRLAET